MKKRFTNLKGEDVTGKKKSKYVEKKHDSKLENRDALIEFVEIFNENKITNEEYINIYYKMINKLSATLFENLEDYYKEFKNIINEMINKKREMDKG